MPQQQDRMRLRKLSRVAVAALLAFTTTVDPILAQTLAQAPAPDAPPAGAAPAEAKVFSLADLEYLVGPIALYPDPLIALILPASTFPLQVVQADRWVAANAEAIQKNDFSGAESQGWDSSVMALIRFPDVLQMMSDHLDWTQSLGSAFSQQPQDVANAVQSLRAQAQKVGNLKTTPQQVVTVRQEAGASAPVIFIEPATPDRIYVPVYDPGLVFTSVVATGLIFGTGVLVGSYWNNRWGWNNRGWNTIWVNQPVWVPGRPGGPPPGAWRPDRPGNRPDRPGFRPDRPGGRPDRPVRPDRPNLRPDRPGADRPGVRPDLPVRPDRPGVRPDRPGARPDRPNVRPDRPGARPDRPNVRPDRPNVRPDRPAVRPDRPAARPDRPAARPDRPAARPNRPQARPDRPAARPNPPAARPNRPAARPNPPAARPNRPQARPNPPANRPQARPNPGNRGGGGGAGAVRNRARNNN